MRIAIVYDVVYPYRMGGGEKLNWEVAKRLAARGHDVSLLSLKMWDGEDVIESDGVKLVGVCPWNDELFKGGKRSLKEPFYFARHLKAHLRDNEYDVIDCCGFPFIPCFTVRSVTRSRKCGVTIKWYEVRGLLRWLEHKGILGVPAWILELLVARLRVAHVAISSHTKKRAARILGRSNMTMIPCGVDTQTALRRDLDDKNDQILYVGRLAPYKRVDRLISAFAAVCNAAEGCSLKIVGSGGSESELRSQVDEFGLADRVEFAANLTEPELMEEYGKSRIFVLPSEQEGFGIVMIEAMASGTPVIVWDAPHSAAPSLVEHGRDALVVKSQDELVAAIKKLRDDDIFYRAIAREGERTARKFDWDKAIVPAHIMHYEKVFAGK